MRSFSPNSLLSTLLSHPLFFHFLSCRFCSELFLVISILHCPSISLSIPNGKEGADVIPSQTETPDRSSQSHNSHTDCRERLEKKEEKEDRREPVSPHTLLEEGREHLVSRVSSLHSLLVSLSRVFRVCLRTFLLPHLVFQQQEESLSVILGVDRVKDSEGRR